MKQATRTRRVGIFLSLLALCLLVLPESPAEESIFCRACGEAIEGHYVSTGSENYHREHFTCEICRKPLDDNYVVRDGKNYHPECYERHLALRCDLCGGVISGKYIQNYWGHAYHVSHRGEALQCAHCSRFISKRLTGGGWEYSDGRTVCGICRKRAVTTDAQAEELMNEAARRLRKLGLRVETGEVRLHLTGLEEIRGLTGTSSDELRGYTDYSSESFLGMTTKKSVDVYLLFGMPRESALATMAHELMHVWQAERGRLDNDEAFAEGSCNYAAFLVLKEIKTPQARFVLQAMRKSEDEIYGEGFRRVKRFAEEEGHRVWIRQLANEDVLPSGY